MLKTIINSQGIYLNQPIIYNIVETICIVSSLCFLVWIIKLIFEDD
jgi:hypothetical protein